MEESLLKLKMKIKEKKSLKKKMPWKKIKKANKIYESKKDKTALQKGGREKLWRKDFKKNTIK